MAVTEQPYPSQPGRGARAYSFYLPPDQHVSPVLIGGFGTVFGNSGGQSVTLSIGWPSGQVPAGAAQEVILAGGQYASIVTGLQAVYIADQGSGPNGYVIPVSTVAPTFPAGSLPLAVLVLDGVGRIQQVFDQRPSYLSAAPNLGSGMTESVADATKRVYFQNNYAVPRTFALTPQIPQEISLPAPGFLLGAGAVVLSGNVISTPTTYFSSAIKGGQLTVGAINQGYVDPTTGALATRTTQTSGVFPVNCLPIFEATLDSVSLIRNLVDWRPAYA